jgi:hypothetical protein
MSPALVVLWLTAPPAPATPPREVASWAAQRGFRAVAVPTTAEPPYAEAAALEIERLLEEARSLAPEAAQLERLDQLLQQHPELPQAGWWLAERFALERQHVRPQDVGAGAQLEQRRAALEGTRAVTAGADAPAQAATVLAPPLQLQGLRDRDQLLIDGEPVRAGGLVPLGRHHAQIFRANRRVWASWIELDSAPLRLPEVSVPCSDLDLLGTEYGADAPRPAPGVRCSDWAAAHARGGRVQLAFCRADRCEPWQASGSVASSAASAANTAAEPSRPLPAWLTWGAVGLGAAASTALVLWQAGVFDRSPPATEFVFTGPSAAAVRF